MVHFVIFPSLLMEFRIPNAQEYFEVPCGARQHPIMREIEDTVIAIQAI